MRTLRSLLGALLVASAVIATAPATAVTLPSGVTVETVKATQGAQPKASDTVKVHYRGTLLDNGFEFDSSYKRGTPATFPLSQVIPWTQGVATMKVGEKANLLCPAATAYGARGIPGTIPPNSTLSFEVELLAIEK